MEQHISFYKIYIFRFTDFNGILNKNAKQNIVNSMWRENLYIYWRRLYMYKICDKHVLELMVIFTGKDLYWILLLTKLQTLRLATLLK